jgi:septal ring factor EnvC (AmiA/AmiB activator)
MMGLSSPMAPSPQEVILMAQKMALPDAVKATLADVGQQLAALADRQKELTTLQQAVTADRASFDKFVSESNANIASRSASLAAREAALQARTAKFEATLAAFEQALAARESELGASP